ncbi:hypothetical protein GCM10010210_37860 [Pseudonocardia hydrocarbonoxydans]
MFPQLSDHGPGPALSAGSGGDRRLMIDAVHLVEQDRVWPPSPPMQGYVVACLARPPPPRL